ncbi:hypothetical protein [Archaeoglobus sp.]
MAIAMVKCPVCGKFYKYGSKCECGYDQAKIDKMVEVLREINVGFEDYLRFLVYHYDLECLKGTEIGEIVRLARKILLEEVDSDEKFRV